MAQRVYFANTTAADVSPAYDSGWGDTSQAHRRKLYLSKISSETPSLESLVTTAEAAGSNTLSRQFVSDQLEAGVVISGTIKGQMLVRESASNDNLDQLLMSIRVVDSAGTTVQATILSLGAYGTVAEFGVNTANHNKALANGDSLSSYTTALNDRLVVEIGYGTSVGGTTPGAKGNWGDNGSDLPEDETTIDTAAVPWLEFSNDLSAPPAGTTRFYFPGPNLAHIAPDADGAWDRQAASFTRLQMYTDITGDDSSWIATSFFGASSTSNTIYRQFISKPLIAQTIDGDFSMVLSVEGDDAVNAHLGFVLKVVGPDGVERGTLLSVLDTTSPEVPLESDTGYATRSFSATAVTPVDALDGDRILLEIGFHAESPSADGILSLQFRATAADTDFTLADDTLDDDLHNTWAEFGQILEFETPGSAWAFGSPSRSLDAFATGEVETTIFVSGAPVATLSATASGAVSTTPGNHVTGSPSRRLDANASGAVVNAAPQPITASGSPSRRLDANASGDVTRDVEITAAGAPTRRLRAFATGHVSNPDSPVITSRARGGRKVVIQPDDEKKPKQKKVKKRKERPAADAAPLPDPEVLNTPAHELMELNRDAWQRILSRSNPPLPPVKPKPKYTRSEKSVEDQLMEHFLNSVGVDTGDVPFMLERFLRQGH